MANVTGLILYLRFGGTASNGARGNIFEEPVWGENVCILRYKMAYSGALFWATEGPHTLRGPGIPPFDGPDV